ncbi:MAG: DUF4388 domain-containing protein [candidate division Zixibacteria bacterium]|nr:DUF4388 domain-containing protein [candidate division Zixibacteria bacterium]MDH3938383.1 DUF4388 domain-containing protein [candidate division Zixibacteria bacterium]MDH4035164.1 DUF4388 domain-containing protein [candidate division Zixibacteria bacterium]
MSLSGNLKTVSFPDILQLLATGKKTGVLEAKTATRQKEVAFKGGNIIYASSINSSEDLLGNMLLRRGKISKGDLERAITLHKQTGRQLGTTLIDMGLFDKQEIGECLKLQIEEIVYNLFSWGEGDFVFHEDAKPKNAPFTIEMNTMNVVMEGTRRIDEWLEIQKVIPPDDALLDVVLSPKINREEITISLDEFRILALINGDRTVPDLINMSPMGEFVTCRSVYKLINQKLVESIGKRDAEEPEVEDEEEVLLAIVFQLYNQCFFRIRSTVEALVGEGNNCLPAFSSQYRGGVLNFFPGLDPSSELAPSFDKFLHAVKALPSAIRHHHLMGALENMLTEQLEYVFRLLGTGAYRRAMGNVKKEISQPLATRRELVKRFGLDENLYQTMRRADKVVKMIREQ